MPGMLPAPMIVHDTLPNGVRLVTERMPHVRSVTSASG